MKVLIPEIVKEEPIPERFNLNQLYELTNKQSMRKIAISTFRRWRNKAGVKPDSDGLYGKEELDFLVELSWYLSISRFNTITKFLNKEKKTIEDKENDRRFEQWQQRQKSAEPKYSQLNSGRDFQRETEGYKVITIS